MREPIVINAETREITVPETERAFGVAGERKVEVKHIRIEGRTVDGTDLTQGFTWKVSCENAGKELCADLIDGIVADAGNIEFDWIVGAAPMAYKGTMHFAVCAVRVDAAGNILQEWHSKLGAGDVANGIEATVQNIGGQDLLAHIQSITAAAQQNAAAAQQNAAAAQRDAAAAAKSAEDAANSAAAAKDSEDAAASSATDAAKSQSAAAASERNAEASKKLAATSESNASASASAAAASETAAKASANKAQALVEGIPDDYATALKDISRLKENKLDKPNNPVVGQLLRIKTVNEDGSVVLESVENTGGVTDVTVNGVSIVEEDVAKVPLASVASPGVVQLGNSSDLVGRADNKAVRPSDIDSAAKLALCDGKGAAWTDAEKTGAWSRLNTIKDVIDSVAVAGCTYLLGEQTYVNITLPSDALPGQKITFAFSSGATACTLAVDADNFDFVPKAGATNFITFLCIATDKWLADAREG